ncbi:hypothetical protein Pla175_28830 [Pirellulimonas nuda]|uniref:Uncharacterized protein n=1 Tax=Pirellulimonas nuda TaxID=2528009 RepID=A0A518DDD6_9BACT|nr:hypothetical protein [Pirellulimonas nuda]QDU89492.1 hypothetical protein Pla175_28830 [Pirellulimonas nuda]
MTADLSYGLGPHSSTTHAELHAELDACEAARPSPEPAPATQEAAADPAGAPPCAGWDAAPLFGPPPWPRLPGAEALLADCPPCPDGQDEWTSAALIERLRSREQQPPQQGPGGPSPSQLPTERWTRGENDGPEPNPEALRWGSWPTTAAEEAAFAAAYGDVWREQRGLEAALSECRRCDQSGIDYFAAGGDPHLAGARLAAVRRQPDQSPDYLPPDQADSEEVQHLSDAHAAGDPLALGQAVEFLKRNPRYRSHAPVGPSLPGAVVRRGSAGGVLDSASRVLAFQERAAEMYEGESPLMQTALEHVLAAEAAHADTSALLADAELPIQQKLRCQLDSNRNTTEALKQLDLMSRIEQRRSAQRERQSSH